MVGNGMDSIVDEVLEDIDFPRLAKKPHNRVSCKAEYRLNGILTENTFYFRKYKNNIDIDFTDKQLKKTGRFNC
jgi:hypothetical protein